MVVAVGLLELEDRVDELVDEPDRLGSVSALDAGAAPAVVEQRRGTASAAGRSIVRAIDAAVSASMLIFVTYCSSETS